MSIDFMILFDDIEWLELVLKDKLDGWNPRGCDVIMQDVRAVLNGGEFHPKPKKTKTKNNMPEGAREVSERSVKCVVETCCWNIFKNHFYNHQSNCDGEFAELCGKLKCDISKVQSFYDKALGRMDEALTFGWKANDFCDFYWHYAKFSNLFDELARAMADNIGWKYAVGVYVYEYDDCVSETEFGMDGIEMGALEDLKDKFHESDGVMVL